MNTIEPESENKLSIATRSQSADHAFDWPDDQQDSSSLDPDVTSIQGRHVSNWWVFWFATWTGTTSGVGFALRWFVGRRGGAVRVCARGSYLLDVLVAWQAIGACGHRRNVDRRNMRYGILFDSHCTAGGGGCVRGWSFIFEIDTGKEISDFHHNRTEPIIGALEFFHDGLAASSDGAGRIYRRLDCMAEIVLVELGIP